MLPERVFYDSHCAAVAGELAEAVDCYNITSPSSQRIDEDAVEDVYMALSGGGGKDIRRVLNRLVEAVANAHIQKDHAYAQEIQDILTESLELL